MFCRKCGKEYEGKFCPNCGEPAEPGVIVEPQKSATLLNGVEINTASVAAPVKEPFYSQTWFVLLMMLCCCFPIGLFLMWKYKKFNKPVRIIITIFFVFCFIIGIYGNLSTVPQDTQLAETVKAAEITKTETAPTTAGQSESKEETTAAETTTAETSTEAEKIPTEYQSALAKANLYSDIMSMSKAAVYNQLTSEYGEKFSPEAAQYAMEHLTADWNANALAKAKTYSDTMFMSKAAIYDQLVSEYGEQFTKDEAQYAIDHLTADWNANALAKAKVYQESMNMSPSAIHDQLTSEYGEKFTKAEADFAIANLE